VRGAGAAALLLLLLAVPAAAQTPPGPPGQERRQREMEPRQMAVLQGLDKATARTGTFAVPVGGQAEFGTLLVRVRACMEAAPIETPESAAFLEIWDRRPGEDPDERFSGWMFASSPALSALEHPVYDVWVVACRNADTSASPSPSAGNPASR
jgi:hypothetical protein